MRQFNKSSIISKIKISCIIHIYMDIMVGIYWTSLTMILIIMNNEIATKYQFYTWFGGMIGVFAVYDTFLAGYYAMSMRGKKVIAFACLCITTDWLLHGWEFLYYTTDELESISYILMACHAITVFWSILFFYGHALKVGRATHIFNMSWISLTTEWIDIIFMYIVILILHNILDGNCFNMSLCIGYFVICSIKLYFWFFPIMFGYADTEWYIHIHMMILDIFTDLPLIIVVIVNEGYELHPFIYFDIVYKLIMLLRTIAYHGVVNLILRRVELNALHKQQLFQSKSFHEDDDSDNELEHEQMINDDHDDHEGDPLLI